MYQTPTFPQFNYVSIPSGHIRAQPIPLATHQFPSQVAYQTMPTQLYFNPSAAAQAYGQMTGNPSTNGQRQTSTPTSGPQSMGQPSSEYPNYMFDMQTVMQPPPQQPAQQTPQQPAPQKAPKKSRAIPIIDPNTGLNILDGAKETNSGTAAVASAAIKISSSTSNNNNNPSSNTSSSSSGNVNMNELTEKVNHISIVKDNEGISEKDNGEPLTPVVSAMSDGPSVDITPKHQVNKIKKMKPPESQQQQPIVVVPIQAVPIAIPVEIPIQVVPIAIVEAAQEIVEIVQDCENNNEQHLELEQDLVMDVEEPVLELAALPIEVSLPMTVESSTVNSIDINDTNNNNYQKVTDDSVSNEGESSTADHHHHQPLAVEQFDETDRAAIVEILQQDTNNNSTETDEKAEAAVLSMLAEGLIAYDDDQWSPVNMAGKKYYTRDQLLKLKDASLVSPLKLPEGVANQLMKNNKDCLANTLTQTMPPIGLRMQPFDAINSVAPKFMSMQQGGRNPYPPKRNSQQGNKQQVKIS